jgi:hypothetical protein
LARESLLRTAREVLIIAKHIDLTTGTAISIHDPPQDTSTPFRCLVKEQQAAIISIWQRFRGYLAVLQFVFNLDRSFDRRLETGHSLIVKLAFQLD